MYTDKELENNKIYAKGFEEGEASSWDLARNKGFDEGFESGFSAGQEAVYKKFLSTWDESGMCNTPETINDLQDNLKVLGIEGVMATGMLINFIRKWMSDEANKL